MDVWGVATRRYSSAINRLSTILRRSCPSPPKQTHRARNFCLVGQERSYCRIARRLIILSLSTFAHRLIRDTLRLRRLLCLPHISHRSEYCEISVLFSPGGAAFVFAWL